MTPPLVLPHIDIRAFYERHGCVVVGKSTNSKEGKEWAASCPRCGGRDRFSFWESGRFHCIRGCGWHGSSPYWFLRDENYSHRQACDDLGIDPSELFGSDSYSHVTPSLPLFLTRDKPPVQKWQDAAHAFCQAAEKCLWSDKGETAIAYLHSRGFTDATIKQAHLGLCPGWYKVPLADWGLSPEQLGKSDDPQIKIPRGITIPWRVDGAIWKIQLRRPDGQYFEVLGSSECLYSVDTFQPGQAVLLVESELDALSAQQEASDLVTCVATGSTTKALTGRWIAHLKRASHILQAFDDDEAGERGAQSWRKALKDEKITRWRPYQHDVNDMLRAEDSIRQWVEQGLETAQEDAFSVESEGIEAEQPIERSAQIFTNPPAEQAIHWKEIADYSMQERIAAFRRTPCAACGGIEWMLDDDGLLVCPCVVKGREVTREQLVQVVQVDSKGLGGNQCLKHGKRLLYSDEMGGRYCSHVDCWERYRLIRQGVALGYPELIGVIDSREHMPDINKLPLRYTKADYPGGPTYPIYPCRPIIRKQLIASGADTWRDYVRDWDYQNIDQAVRAALYVSSARN